MQIFCKTLTGKSITLQVGDSIQIGPLKEDGTFKITTRWGEAEALGEAQLMYAPNMFCKLTPGK